ncbi:hypothetical protein [Sinorhizobium meliloti]|uniref:hypothetical protein n=1 Tax=Rhizobium meliloti TaxID=382 RepID=UPI000FE05600|nr:hypothetical protein [Sinorhizobium meliloti]RVG70871.1 hypothetical protein CN222_01675 [Sinorhizobium meliloti]
MMTEPMPLGWFDLVTDLRLALMKDYPGIAITEMSADRGWLHVRCDDGGLDPASRLRLDRLVQGYVTQSLTTCMSCGSYHGRDRRGRRVICDECESTKETCNA